MTPSEAAALVPVYVAEAQARIKGNDARADYGSPEGERFERQSLESLTDYAREELLDQINYSVFALYRLDQLRATLRELDPALARADVLRVIQQGPSE